MWVRPSLFCCASFSWYSILLDAPLLVGSHSQPWAIAWIPRLDRLFVTKFSFSHCQLAKEWLPFRILINLNLYFS